MKYRLTTESREALQTLPIYKKIGFEFNEGWFELIFDLGQKITDFCQENDLELPHPQQIKEKFGTLRFYCSIPEDKDEQIRNWIRAAEDKSDTTCEACGKAGNLLCDQGRWYTTCANHLIKGSYTPEEFKVIQEERGKARRKCDVCGEKGADSFYDPSTKSHSNRCLTHIEPYFITAKEYWEKKNEEFDLVKENNVPNVK